MRVVRAHAPTRIDFGGGWTDVPPYTNEQGGCVCNLAIARWATVTLRAADEGVTIDDDGVTSHAARVEDFPADGHAALARAALRRAKVGSVHLALHNDFPFGSGLGGSSAAGVALAAALAHWCGDSVDPVALAARSRALEVDELRVPGGFQDHYAAALGGALALEFGDGVTARRIPLSPPLVAALERRCIVAFTGRSRISGDTITAVLDGYRDRVPRVTTALARMKILAGQMVGALERESVDELAGLVAEHWQHQRALHPAITTPEIERLMTVAGTAGALGGKAMGASGGGCVLLIAAADRADELRTAVAREAEMIPFTVDLEGVQLQTVPLAAVS